MLKQMRILWLDNYHKIITFAKNNYIMTKEIIPNFSYANNLLQLREIATEPSMSEQFHELIILVRTKLYKFIETNNEKKHKAYIIALEIATVIDYIYRVYDDRDTYPCEKIIKRYGYEIKDLLDDEIFKYVLE